MPPSDRPRPSHTSQPRFETTDRSRAPSLPQSRWSSGSANGPTPSFAPPMPPPSMAPLGPAPLPPSNPSSSRSPGFGASNAGASSIVKTHSTASSRPSRISNTAPPPPPPPPPSSSKPNNNFSQRPGPPPPPPPTRSNPTRPMPPPPKGPPPPPPPVPQRDSAPPPHAPSSRPSSFTGPPPPPPPRTDYNHHRTINYDISFERNYNFPSPNTFCDPPIFKKENRHYQSKNMKSNPAARASHPPPNNR